MIEIEDIDMSRYKQVFINGKETLYYVSKTGDVISLYKNRVKRLKVFQTIIKPKKCKKRRQGYLYVKLTINGKSKAAFIHRLVATAYIPNPENKPEVNHKDGNKHNNYINNLEWATSKENKKHARENKLSNYAQCEQCGRAKYKNKEIEYACSLLEKNELTIKQIAELSHVDADTLYNIRSKGIYKKISKKYKFPKKPKPYSYKYTDEQIENICKLRTQGETIKNISKITGVPEGTVSDVVKGKRRKDISKKYKL